jgi:hypothetical protein
VGEGRCNVAADMHVDRIWQSVNMIALMEMMRFHRFPFLAANPV